jgi:outer membrane immunogenic protein
MKKILLALSAMAIGTAAASAADLPARTYTKAPPPPPPPIFSWTGFYIGGNIGGAWSNNRFTDTIFLTNFGNNNTGVFIGGGQVGGNYQIGQFVIGGEWDFDWAANSNNSAGVIIPGAPGLGTVVVTNNNRWVTTVAARFGWAINHFLLYGKAGGAWVGSNNFNISTTSGLFLNCGTFGFTNCNNNTGGWVAGAGVEYAFTNNWTVKAEYDYIGLGNRTFFVPVGVGGPFAGDTFTTNNRNVQMFKVGFNYLFNWGAPIAARY